MPHTAARLRVHATSQIIIPARLASTRLPRKLLLAETGQTLIEHTYRAAQRARRPGGVCVACDHPDIYEAVSGFGGHAVMTDPNAPSGTDRPASSSQQDTTTPTALSRAKKATMTAPRVPRLSAIAGTTLKCTASTSSNPQAACVGKGVENPQSR